VFQVASNVAQHTWRSGKKRKSQMEAEKSQWMRSQKSEGLVGRKASWELEGMTSVCYKNQTMGVELKTRG
jgi:hypothetical protein